MDKIDHSLYWKVAAVVAVIGLFNIESNAVAGTGLLIIAVMLFIAGQFLRHLNHRS